MKLFLRLKTEWIPSWDASITSIFFLVLPNFTMEMPWNQLWMLLLYWIQPCVVQIHFFSTTPCIIYLLGNYAPLIAHKKSLLTVINKISPTSWIPCGIWIINCGTDCACWIAFSVKSIQQFILGGGPGTCKFSWHSPAHIAVQICAWVSFSLTESGDAHKQSFYLEALVLSWKQGETTDSWFIVSLVAMYSAS